MVFTLEYFRTYTYEKIVDVYHSFCTYCESFASSISQSGDIWFNNVEDINKINETYDLLQNIDVIIDNAFTIINRVEEVLEGSDNAKLKDFQIYTNILAGHIQASHDMSTILKDLSEALKSKV